jgi:hypothetical protein
MSMSESLITQAKTNLQVLLSRGFIAKEIISHVMLCETNLRAILFTFVPLDLWMLYFSSLNMYLS